MATIIAYKTETEIHVLCEGLVPNELYTVGFYHDREITHKICYLSRCMFTPNETHQVRDMVAKMLRWKIGKYSEKINPNSR